MTGNGARPLRGLRVVSLADERLPSLGKAFVDLGADVDVVRAAGTSSLRPLLALLESRGKTFSDTSVLDERLRRADVLLWTPGGYDLDALARAHPHLVIAAVTDFGRTGPRRDWTGTDAVFHALGGTLARSGEPGCPPLPPPGELFLRGAAQQIAWAVLVALYRSLTGPERRGVVLDCSILECGTVCFDPAFGMTGSGTPDSLTHPGRPAVAAVYPIFQVRDGLVRVCVLARQQWLALLTWMGHPPELAGEDLLTNLGRYARADLVMPAMAAFFADLASTELVTQCRRRGIPASAVLSLADVLREPHYREVGLLAPLGRDVVSAEGMVTINGIRGVPRDLPGDDADDDDEGWTGVQVDAAPMSTGPLSGLTVLDLGVIVAGPETGALFVQQGARVIHVENRHFPDGLRRSFDELTPALARGHLGKESLGLDLRSDQGRAIFLELVRRADVVSSNYKPGTLERLGIAYDDLVRVNPAIVCVESSAFGDVGPWSTAMGYGPLVRAGCGLTWLWRAGAASTGADGSTLFPDHLAGRVAAIAALACVLDRSRTRAGGHVTVAQSDVALVQLAELLAAESLTPGSVQPPGRPGPALLRETVLAAAGDDQWCVVDPVTSEQMYALRAFLGSDADVDTVLAEYVRGRDPGDAARALQAAGVPAAPMLRPHELAHDPALLARQMYFATTVAGTVDTVLAERYPVLPGGTVVPHPAPAETFGESTRAILAELGHPPADVERLLASGVAQQAEVLARATAGSPP